MRLRTQLAVAFLLLAVLPLAGMTAYSYVASLRVVRRAVETETGALAQGLEARLETLTRALDRRLESIRRTGGGRSSAFAQARADALARAERTETELVLRSLLEQTRGEEGELPFALDASGRLIAASDAGAARLRALGVGTGDPSTLGERTGFEDWVVVTRRDADSGYVLGVARPVGEAVREMRATAARNLAWGLGLVAVALVGILPLSRRMTRNLARLAEGAERIASGDLAARVEVRSRDEFGRLAATFNRMAAELAVFHERGLREERLRKELELCRRIQEELLPRRPLRLGGVEVAGVSLPAREVGGDFFNYFALPDEQVAVLVGDVSGKGIAAALLMANLQARLQARLPLEPALGALAESLDHDVAEATPESTYLTLFMGIVDPRRNELRYVNAGHNPPFALRPGSGLEPLDATGRPIGLLPGGGYEERRIRLECGDRLFLYTDGLSEAENAAGEAFGAQLPLLLAGVDDTPGALLTRVESAVVAHRAGREADDDATLLVVGMGNGVPPEASRTVA
jgi:serine phosphatase RsbU (regulator of sigma subunit)